MPITGILALLAVIGITLHSQAPFKGTRPQSETVPQYNEKIPARLWQDPFSAALNHLKNWRKAKSRPIWKRSA